MLETSYHTTPKTPHFTSPTNNTQDTYTPSIHPSIYPPGQTDK